MHLVINSYGATLEKENQMSDFDENFVLHLSIIDIAKSCH